MKIKIGIFTALLAITIVFTGCGGVSQADYDNLQAENQALQEQINSMVQPPTYFENRTAIENWLKFVPKLGISEDVEQWFQFALYYQRKALEAGYIISVSYSVHGNKVSLTCDIITEDGWLYYFDPDDCVLKDTSLRIDMVDDETLESKYAGSML